ncbi:Uncharacterized protein PBTT_00114 [Plasmodiophora brassicae]|uniref:Uncharacterized protein n=1 Tax=Plasmodiophora brassicae TaxID=37360 RepID=A0A0G4J3T1_PLABS|nr:hypothetical protein PBRA_002412 [Plasmodiophora brassicae]SPQ93662.1 unnamed protein product [Plasmodiophora brassicae]
MLTEAPGALLPAPLQVVQGGAPRRPSRFSKRHGCPPIELASIVVTQRAYDGARWGPPIEVHAATQTDANELGDLGLAYAEVQRLQDVVRDVRAEVVRAEDRVRLELERRSGDATLTLQSYYKAKLDEQTTRAQNELLATVAKHQSTVEAMRAEFDAKIASIENALLTAGPATKGPVLATDAQLRDFCVQQEIALALQRQDTFALQQQLDDLRSARTSSHKGVSEDDAGELREEIRALTERLAGYDTLFSVQCDRETRLVREQDGKIRDLTAETGRLRTALDESVSKVQALTEQVVAERMAHESAIAGLRQSHSSEIQLLDIVIKSKQDEIARLQVELAEAKKTIEQQQSRRGRRRRQASVGGTEQGNLRQNSSATEEDLMGFSMQWQRHSSNSIPEATTSGDDPDGRRRSRGTIR